jgi:uncharacterized membrane protein YfcA
MEILGYFAAILVGLSFGLIGSGGSILTMPILVYLFGIQPTLATSYSLCIVGITCLTGAVQKYRSGFVDVRVSLLFGLVSVTSVILTRKFILPAIPGDITTIGSIKITKALLTMILLASLMLVSAISMIRNSYKHPGDDVWIRINPNYPVLLFCGLGIGMVTGLLGVGGGFLLVPTLVLLAGIPMKKAIGTSLTIITLNTLMGIISDAASFHLDWLLLGKLIAIAVTGVFMGNAISKKVSGEKLKKGFGWFVLVLSIYIVCKEVFFR